MQQLVDKTSASDLAALGGKPLFSPPISTSNLVRPEVDVFLEYSKYIFNEQQGASEQNIIELFEKRFADFHQTQHCVAVSNGFWALVLAIKCLALDGKNEVIMPSLTYRRLADVVAWTKLTPRFCEVDADTLAIDPKAAATCINENTALLLGVHPIVNTCDVYGLEEVAKAAGIPLLFDAVESVYETVSGKKVGSFGEAECFSMHASKLINGFEGGYITTNNAALADRLREMRAFGQGLGINAIGINAKLSGMHAAMGLASLGDLEDQIKRNQQRYRIYQQLFSNIQGVRLLEFDEHEKTSYKNIVVELTHDWPLSRAETIQLLNKEGALARAYYSPPLHTKPMRYAYIPAQLPLTEMLSERYMLLPCGHLVTAEDIEHLAALFLLISQHADEIKRSLA